MSLFGSLQTASNTLQAVQIGLQVTGNNISNANTPGFIRERANFAPAPVQQIGNLQVGLGVKVDSITQVLDRYLGEQLRGASADKVAADLRNDAYKGLEQIVGELSDNDLSTALSQFFGSIHDTTNALAGDAPSVRNLAVLEGKQLANEVQRIDGQAKNLRDSYDRQIIDAAGEVNRLAKEIQSLNIQITQVEGGGAGASQAGALRSQRNTALNDLADLVDVNAVEQPSGGLAVSIGGEFLVFEGQRRDVTVNSGSSSGLSNTRLEFADTGKELQLTSGRVFGLTSARDEVVGGFRDTLDKFAKTLIFEFNKVYSQGQGLNGFSSLASVDATRTPDAPLDAAGLTFTPENGSFQITVANSNTGSQQTAVIPVRLLGFDNDTTLTSLASDINAVEGISASVDATGRLRITADSKDTTFSFAQDTSGALAALGLNTFFTGGTAATIGVNQELDGVENAGKFAASDAGVGGGTGNAVKLASLVDQPLDALDGVSITDLYDQSVNELSQNSTVAGSVADGLGVYRSTLDSKFQAVSGVNIDEEAINLVALQRTFQATARYIQTIQTLLDALVRL